MRSSQARKAKNRIQRSLARSDEQLRRLKNVKSIRSILGTQSFNASGATGISEAFKEMLYNSQHLSPADKTRVAPNR